ncbi:hypothetical protein GYH30_005522 [Glycine max]|nr:hypothetical protein JHK86_005684 [Glycine max]KAH1062597.1 hypothetical protein GYH30_005522 [Glycine max]
MMEDKNKKKKKRSKLWLKKVSWPFRWKRLDLQTTIMDTVVFKVGMNNLKSINYEFWRTNFPTITFFVSSSYFSFPL